MTSQSPLTSVLVSAAAAAHDAVEPYAPSTSKRSDTSTAPLRSTSPTHASGCCVCCSCCCCCCCSLYCGGCCATVVTAREAATVSASPRCHIAGLVPLLLRRRGDPQRDLVNAVR